MSVSKVPGQGATPAQVGLEYTTETGATFPNTLFSTQGVNSTSGSTPTTVAVTTSNPSAPVKGQIIFDSTNSKMMVWDGQRWWGVALT